MSICKIHGYDRCDECGWCQVCFKNIRHQDMHFKKTKLCISCQESDGNILCDEEFCDCDCHIMPKPLTKDKLYCNCGVNQEEEQCKQAYLPKDVKSAILWLEKQIECFEFDGENTDVARETKSIKNRAIINLIEKAFPFIKEVKPNSSQR